MAGLRGRPPVILDVPVELPQHTRALFRGWVDPIDPWGALPADAQFSRADVQRLAIARERLERGEDDPERTPRSSRRRCLVRCPLTQNVRPQSFRSLVALGCTCFACARVRVRANLWSRADDLGRGWIVDEMVLASPDLNPQIVTADSREPVAWQCHVCGTTRSASP